MTIARRSLEDGGAAVPGSAPTPDSASGLAAARPNLSAERPDVPIWAIAVGVVLVVMFAGLVVQTFTGRSLVSRLAALAPRSGSKILSDADRPRVLYVPGSTV